MADDFGQYARAFFTEDVSVLLFSRWRTIRNSTMWPILNWIKPVWTHRGNRWTWAFILGYGGQARSSVTRGTNWQWTKYRACRWIAEFGHIKMGAKFHYLIGMTHAEVKFWSAIFQAFAHAFTFMNGPNFPGLVPLHIPGKEPLPPGVSDEERDAYEQMKKTERFMTMASETCAFKTVLAGGGGEYLWPSVFSLLGLSSFVSQDWPLVPSSL